MNGLSLKQFVSILIAVGGIWPILMWASGVYFTASDARALVIQLDNRFHQIATRQAWGLVEIAQTQAMILQFRIADCKAKHDDSVSCQMADTQYQQAETRVIDANNEALSMSKEIAK